VPQVQRRLDGGGDLGAGVLTVAGAPSTGWHRTGGVLRCDGVPVETIAREVGTPTYVYSAGVVREHFRRLAAAFAPVPHRVHYSMKANSNLALLTLLRELGAGVDIVSGGELHRAGLAGFAGGDVVFSGVGKSEREIEAALDVGVRFINVESEGELRPISQVAARRGVRAPVALRVNPEVSVANPHDYIKTGEKGNKFGIPWDEARDAARLARALPGLALVGLDMHIGSQITSHVPYSHALERMMELLAGVRADGAGEIAYLDIGGGLFVPYEGEAPADVEGFASIVIEATRGADVTLVLEPGRYLVAAAGALLTRVLYRKRTGGKEFIITDAGMNDLMRPSHYQAYHQVEAAAPRGGRVVADVVGPVCESGDFLALDRETDDVEPGELVIVHTAGAYGYVMSSNYNSRPRPAEVLVDGDRWAVVSDRERYEDLVRLERLTPDWRPA
jgi:diaminopimelate decarboxylase